MPVGSLTMRTVLRACRVPALHSISQSYFMACSGDARCIRYRAGSRRAGVVGVTSVPVPS